MKRLKKIVLSLFVTISMFSLVVPSTLRQVRALDYDKKITIIHTNDVHSYVDVEPYVKGYANKLETAGEAYTIVSAGDAFAGTSFASMSRGLDVATVMNAVGYDMMTLGNHEYAMKFDMLSDIVDAANFPILGANAEPDLLAAIPDVEEYVIKDYNGTKIAYLGLTTAYNPEGFGARTVAKAEELKAKAAAEGATIFIGVTHLGVKDPNPELTSKYLAEKCDWFTAIVDAHCHTVHDGGLIHNGVLIAETGEYGNNFGVMELYIKDNKVVDVTSTIIPVSEAESRGITPDAQIQQIIDDVRAKNETILKEVMFTTPVDLTGNRQVIRKQETNLGNIVSDAYLATAKGNADVSFAPGVTIRQDLPKGDVTYDELLNTLGSEQRLLSFELSGKEIYAAMENALATYPEENNNFQHFAGMKVYFDPTRPVGERIEKIVLDDGRTVEADVVYRAITREDMLAWFLSDERLANFEYIAHGSVYPDFITYAKANAHTFKAEIEGRLVDTTQVVDHEVELQVYASNFDIRYDKLSTLDLKQIQSLVNLTVTIDGEVVDAYTVDIDETSLKAIKNAKNENKTYPLFLTVSYTDAQNELYTQTVQIDVQVKAVDQAQPSTTLNAGGSVNTYDPTSIVLLYGLLACSALGIMYTRKRKA
ncbi:MULTISPECIES: 5'-nucleotidase C-terminal domain-containing protein [unclassified Breznakia]|uniref:bifunctional metallophosphatase/5'-nucleotidase n=1 Tax=unclassified Breznakia TaxID=2623764 RepID=UPI0024745763|nr:MULTISPECIES: 5'-nucleotidase C-terminal domain-containing protein [unclassified Breznakia]MDH6366380.1 5'-nucleotidase/UDP-sugar diphosphatase [Breznakia sp. PH1-1]MDH6403473.1 5'-nucleotidase/UDP-sugar diphosphatase [Breznakia sp. PF1-11]MDH6411182.1 5'-nucleotidase/UDP-sugar diphosphatase [Breznakia sp. PFB1-11]MDH6413555.1 5'-nucleotidase/UDP-sugar diphosphatase [Breznakia sp. PFB1-14]MDH6415727.1 5'-nucleotidase/UDP-sugar diphosphatase [Breznakia sp. PFB1-4]